MLLLLFRDYELTEPGIAFVWLANAIGTPKDERMCALQLVAVVTAHVSAVKLIFTILVSYPFAGLLKRLPDTEPWKKNVFLIGSALFLPFHPLSPPLPAVSR